jgi:hypothetical protein
VVAWNRSLSKTLIHGLICKEQLMVQREGPVVLDHLFTTLTYEDCSVCAPTSAEYDVAPASAEYDVILLFKLLGRTLSWLTFYFLIGDLRVHPRCH